MNPLTQLGDAAIGWLDLLGGRPSAERFRPTRAGLAIAVGWYFAIVLFAQFVQMQLLFGTLPDVEQVFLSLLLNAVPLLAVSFVAFVTLRMLKPAATLLDFLVPATYGLVFILVLTLPLSLFGLNQVSSALHGLFGYMLYRLARDTGKFGLGVSIAYAALSVLLLVAVPVALYMLMVPEIPTPG